VFLSPLLSTNVKVPGKDIFGLDKIICPVNLGNTHWCCAVIFMNDKKIQFYDSMGGSGRHYINGLFQYVQDEHQDKKKSALSNKEDWELVECQPDTPQQMNGYDCGVFTCAFADFISRGAPLAFTQDHVTELRERIALAIVKNDAMI
jgi:sentrin-specific protease 1